MNSNQTPYSFSDLVDIMARLRAPNGCPWDREQTHESILSCLIEEAYEFVDAVEKKDLPNMREELGDLLLQVVFHSRMAQEADHFDIDGVIQILCEKLVRRHPHVFGEQKLERAEEVVTQWEAIKKTEKEGAEKTQGALGEIPTHLPALLKALKISKRAVKVGFEWPDLQGVAAKVREELAEFEAEAAGGDQEAREEELGDLLFSVVNLGRFVDVDPERALARSNAKFVVRFQVMETLAKQRDLPLEKLDAAGWDELWNQAKAAVALQK